MLTLRAANVCAVLPTILGTIVSVAHADDQLAAMAAAADQARKTVTAWHGPTNSPPLQKGKTIYAITCASQGIGCVRAANGAKEGGEAAGWTVRVIDGKGDPGNLEWRDPVCNRGKGRRHCAGSGAARAGG